MLGKIVILCLVTVAWGFPEPPRPYLNATGSRPGHPGSGKIINGINANENQFPYIVSLNYKGDGHACGASILTPSWALTAAHCCLTGAATELYWGSIYLSRGGRTLQIREYIVHENYDPNNSWSNDICLLHLDGEITLGANAQQVTLISSGFNVPDGSDVVIPGWGYTTAESPQNIPDRLQVVTQYRALSGSNCQRQSGVPDTPVHICAVGSGGQGVCQGDSGGPLTYNGAQVGITSFVFLPCGSGYPDYYARVANYIDWIQQKLGRDASLLKLI